MNLGSLKATVKVEGTAYGSYGAAQAIFLQSMSTFTDGTGTGKSNKVVVREDVTLSATSADVDLAGSYTDAFGATVTLTKLHGILITHTSEDASILTVAQASSNGVANLFTGASDGVKVPDGGALFYVNNEGLAITAGTGDKLTLTASATSVYSMVFWGE